MPVPPVVNVDVDSGAVDVNSGTSPQEEREGAEVVSVVATKEKQSNKVTNEPGGEAEREEDEMEEEIALAGTVEADCLSGLSEDGTMAGDQHLPTLTEGLGEVRELARLQELDDSLSEWRRKGVEQEEGFMLDGNEVLLQTKFIIPGREVHRVVVPTFRRREILEVAHRGLAGGHYSHKKMVECLLQHFTWPGLRGDVKRYCVACPDCQRAGRVLQPRVPMVETPIISTPYSRLACDLVGPLTRTKAGHKYLLMVMCVGTRFPYAIPLKRVDAETVAEGLAEVGHP